MNTLLGSIPFAFNDSEGYAVQLKPDFTNIEIGIAAPNSSLGRDGNVFYDSVDNAMYVKVAGTWRKLDEAEDGAFRGAWQSASVSPYSVGNVVIVQYPSDFPSNDGLSSQYRMFRLHFADDNPTVSPITNTNWVKLFTDRSNQLEDMPDEDEVALAVGYSLRVNSAGTGYELYLPAAFDDSELNARIDSERAARIAADEAEQAARVQGDSELGVRIDTNSTNITTLQTEVGRIQYRVVGNTLTLTRPDGTDTEFTVTSADGNTTYQLEDSEDGVLQRIVLVGSDGTRDAVTIRGTDTDEVDSEIDFIDRRSGTTFRSEVFAVASNNVFEMADVSGVPTLRPYVAPTGFRGTVSNMPASQNWFANAYAQRTSVASRTAGGSITGIQDVLVDGSASGVSISFPNITWTPPVSTGNHSIVVDIEGTNSAGTAETFRFTHNWSVYEPYGHVTNFSGSGTPTFSQIIFADRGLNSNESFAGIGNTWIFDTVDDRLTFHNGPYLINPISKGAITLTGANGTGRSYYYYHVGNFLHETDFTIKGA